MDGWMDGWIDGWMDGWMVRNTMKNKTLFINQAPALVGYKHKLKQHDNNIN